MSVVLNGRPMGGLVEAATRTKPWRDAAGDLKSLLAGAREEHDREEYENAYTAYRMALAEALRRKWIQHSGKAGSPINDPATLQAKLRAGNSIDHWLDHLLKATNHRPCPIEPNHVRILSAIVETLAEGLS